MTIRDLAVHVARYMSALVNDPDTAPSLEKDLVEASQAISDPDQRAKAFELSDRCAHNPVAILKLKGGV